MFWKNMDIYSPQKNEKGALTMENNILLESGTNELEVLEFMVGAQSFGINIAKVIEIMNYEPMIPVPDSPPEFEGVFTPRDKVISVIDLHKVLNKESSDPEHDLLTRWT